MVQQRQHGPVNSRFHVVGQHPLVFLAVSLLRDGAFHHGGCMPFSPVHIRPGADAAVFLPGGADAALAGQFLHTVMGLIRQQGDEHLLDAVVPVMTPQRVLHRFSASRM